MVHVAAPLSLTPQTTVAARVAEEMGRDLGGVVGYSVRFDDCTSKTETRIKFCTDGILVRQALADPLLSHVSVVIVDEAHERSLQTDVLLGLLKKVQRKRPDLRVIVSSATMDAELFRDFFETKRQLKKQQASSNKKGKTEDAKRPSRWADAAVAGGGSNKARGDSGENDDGPTATIVSVTGRTHPVSIFYSEKPVRDFVRAAAECVLSIHRQGRDQHSSISRSSSSRSRTNSSSSSQNDYSGDVLVFLPGGEEVDACCRMIKEASDEAELGNGGDSGGGGGPSFSSSSEQLWVLPLYAALPHRDQMRVFERRRGCRKVIVATPIAETSITLPGVVFVVDGGFVKLPYFNPATGVEALITCPCSQASSKQRAGRAGRTQPGKCFRLCPEATFLKLEETTPAEMQRTSLTWPILQLKALGVDDVLHFDFPSPPSAAAMLHGLEILYSLGCLDEVCKLTAMGEALAEFPLEPRLAKVLLMSLPMGCASEVVTIAAMLGVSRDLWLKPRGHRQQLEKLDAATAEFAVNEGDHVTLLNVFRAYEDEALELDSGRDDDDDDGGGGGRGGSRGGCTWGGSGGGGKGGAGAREWCNENMVSERALRRAREVRQQLVGYLKRHVRGSAAARAAAEEEESRARRAAAAAPSVGGGGGGTKPTLLSSSFWETPSWTSSVSSSSSRRPSLPSCDGDTGVIRRCLVTGFFANVARLGSDGLFHTLRGGLTVQLHPSSTLAKFGAPPEFVLFSTFVFIDQAFVRDCSRIDGRWLLELAPHFYTSADARGRRLVPTATAAGGNGADNEALASAVDLGPSSSSMTSYSLAADGGGGESRGGAVAAAASRLLAKEKQGTLLTSDYLGGPATGGLPRPVFSKPVFRKPTASSKDKSSGKRKKK
jgi:ATP-dependent RNA helicase DDX35